jgi:hypothetical protein
MTWKFTYPDQGGGDPRPDRIPNEHSVEETLPMTPTPLGPCERCGDGMQQDETGDYCPSCGHRTNTDIQNARIDMYAPLGEGIGEGPYGLLSHWKTADEVPLDQAVYIAEGAMERAGLVGEKFNVPAGHPHHPTEEGRDSSAQITQIAQQITGDPTLRVHITNEPVWGSDSYAIAAYDAIFHTISVRPQFDMLTLLHECAHAMTRTEEGSHSRQWCEVAHDLYGRYLGEEAASVFWNLLSHKLTTRLSGFRYLSADIEQIAQQKRDEAWGALRAWGEKQEAYLRQEYERNNPEQNPDGHPNALLMQRALNFVNSIPDNGYKLIPWAVREIKKGMLTRGSGIDQNFGHARDIVYQAAQWFDWSREHNRPLPDFMSKSFGFPQLEAWVYEMNNAQSENEGWVDSKPVYTWPDGYHMDLVGANDLAREGELMGHCVGGYCDVVQSGGTSIYSLRDEKDFPHVTIEVSGNYDLTQKAHGPNGQQLRVVQVQGKQDTEPIREYREKVDEWFNHLNSEGWGVTEDDPDREPETDYNSHAEGPYEFTDVDSVLEYGEKMKQKYDRDYHFGDDDEGTWEGNVITYQLPRQLEGIEDLAGITEQFLREWLRGQYDNEQAVEFVQALWLATHHYHTQSQTGYRWDAEESAHSQGDKTYKDLSYDVFNRASEEFRTQPQPQKQPQLFDPGALTGDQPINPKVEWFLNYMGQLAKAPGTEQRRPRNGDPYERSIAWPGEGTWPMTDWNDYFKRTDILPGALSKWKFAAQKWYNEPVEQRPDHDYEVGDHVVIMVGEGKGGEAVVNEVLPDGWIVLHQDGYAPAMYTSAEIMPAPGVSGETWPDTFPEQWGLQPNSRWWLPSKTAADVRQLAQQALDKLFERPDLKKLLDSTTEYQRILGEAFPPKETNPARAFNSFYEKGIDEALRYLSAGWEDHAIVNVLEQVGYRPTVGDPELMTPGDRANVGEAERILDAAKKVQPYWNDVELWSYLVGMTEDLVTRYPEAYKLLPWLVKQIKTNFWPSEVNGEQLNTSHIVDVIGGAGADITKLRQQNQLPEGFDINKMDYQDLEDWHTEYKQENLGKTWDEHNVWATLGNGWTVEEVRTEHDLRMEGELMGHCVGNYCRAVQSGNTIILSLRDPKGLPHVTMEYRPGGSNEEQPGGNVAWKEKPNTYSVVQIQGKSDSMPIPEYRAMIKEFNDGLRAKGIDVQWSSGAYQHRGFDQRQVDQLRKENIYHLNSPEDLDRLVNDYMQNGGTAYFTEPHPAIEDDYGIPRESGVPTRWLDHFELQKILDDILYQVFEGLAPEQEQKYARDLLLAYYALLSQPLRARNPGDSSVQSIVDARQWIVTYINNWQSKLVAQHNEGYQNPQFPQMKQRPPTQYMIEGLDRVSNFRIRISSMNGTQLQQMSVPNVGPQAVPNSGELEGDIRYHQVLQDQDADYHQGLQGEGSWKFSRTTMFHVAPKSRRESIFIHGLSPDRGVWKSPWPGDRKDGVYLWDTPHNARQYGAQAVPITDPDIWAVDVTGLNLSEDPYFDKGKSFNLRHDWIGPHKIPGAFVTMDNIPPDRIHLVEPNPWHPEPSSKDYWNEDTEQFDGRPSLISRDLSFDNIYQWRVPFYVAPNSTHEMGWPGTEHWEMEERRWMRNQAPEMDERDLQGHVIFHPEYGEIPVWPEWMNSPEYDWKKDEILDHARAQYDSVEGLPARTAAVPDNNWIYDIAVNEDYHREPTVIHYTGTLYHGTDPRNIEAIMQEGLRLDINFSDNLHWFTDNPDFAKNYGEPMMFTVEVPRCLVLDYGMRHWHGNEDYDGVLVRYPPAAEGTTGRRPLTRYFILTTQHTANIQTVGPAKDVVMASWKYAVSAIPAQYSEGDPLDLQGKQQVFHNMQVEWWNMSEEKQKQAIINAFRATMLSPRLKLRDNAIMYQEMMSIPPEESDPDVFEAHARQLKERWDRQGQGDLMGEVEPMGWEKQTPGKLTPGFWTNVRRIAALGPYADQLRQDAITDMMEFNGTGKYFRDQVLKLGIPGVGPKVASFAWLALNPKGSDLGTLDVWMMRHLKQDQESPNSPAHYFDLEDQLRDEKDALYGPETPLGQYQWGVWDKIRTPGYHQDHSPLRVYDPTPYHQVAWGDFSRVPRPQQLPEQHPDQEQLFASKEAAHADVTVQQSKDVVMGMPGLVAINSRGQGGRWYGRESLDSS